MVKFHDKYKYAFPSGTMGTSNMYKDELLEDWQLAQDRKSLIKIAPLV